MREQLRSIGIVLVLSFGMCVARCQGKVVELPAGSGLAVRAGIDLSAWNRLLEKYVDDRGRVNYAAWKRSANDLAALDSFRRRIAAPVSNSGASPAAAGAERAATLIDAYNALTIGWVLENYPTESIRSLPDSFSRRRHTVGGRSVSLDDIEGELRKTLGFRVHATISCASRSCPPLSHHAYRAESLEAQLDEAMSRWLGRQDLNRYAPAENRVEISMIFKWYAGDFEKAEGGLRGILAAYAPKPFRDFLRTKDYAVDFRTYDWGLNDQGPHGRNYGGVRKLLDELRP